VAQILNAAANPEPEPIQIHLFVLTGIQRVPSAPRDVFGELHHLVNGFLAREPPDEILDEGAQFGFGFAGFQFEESLDHHRDHYVHPARADQRKGPVEIEENRAGVRDHRD